MGLSSPGKAEIVSLDSGNIDDILSKSSEFSTWLWHNACWSDGAIELQTSDRLFVN